MQKQLDDGLVLRSLSEGFASDQANLGKFYDEVFTEFGDEDGPALRVWAEDLVSDKHPTVTLDDIWVVVDSARDDRIVSALLLIPQTWAYEDISFGVGRVELVATHSEYRQRGLIRALMDVAHERSQVLGHIMQGITGIPHYYRRFGYAMSVDLGGRSTLQFSAVRPLKDGHQPQYALRAATDNDIPDLIRWQEQAASHFVLRSICDENMLHYEINHRTPDTPNSLSIQILEDTDGHGVGFVVLVTSAYFPLASCRNYIVGENSSYIATFDDVMRGIQDFMKSYYAAEDRPEMPTQVHFGSNIPEPAHLLVRNTSSGVVNETPYAWYIRVADLPRFIRAIAPVLERRLIGSGANRYSGDVSIHFFDTTALILTWENGCLKEVKHERMMPEFKADAAFPYDYFLNVLFGHRSPAELQRVLPEIWVNRKATMLFDALFPVRRSGLMPLS